MQEYRLLPVSEREQLILSKAVDLVLDQWYSGGSEFTQEELGVLLSKIDALPLPDTMRVLCKNGLTAQELKDAAMDAEDEFSLDELEDYARKLREPAEQ